MPIDVLTLNKKDNNDSKLKDVYTNAGFSGVPQRSRGPFVTYLLAEKDFTYDQIKQLSDGTLNISDEEKQKLYDDFYKVLEEHPVYDMDDSFNLKVRPDAKENLLVYTNWYNKAMSKMKDYTFPSKESIKTPEDAYEYLNNFNEMSSYVKDIIQEYEKLQKNPEISGYYFDAIDEECIGICSKLENAYYVIGDFKDLSSYGDKTKSAMYPKLMEFIDSVEGKKLSDLKNFDLINTHLKISQFNLNAPNYTKDPEQKDAKYTDFMKTGNADFSNDEIKFTSVFSNKPVNVSEFAAETNDMANELLSDLYEAKDSDRTGKVPQEKIQSLLMNLPYEIDINKNTPEEKAAVHELYCYTACNLREYYSSVANAEMGAKSADLIKIDGKPLSQIVEEKYKDQDLSPEQKKTATEYEFVGALLNKNVKLEYTPYVFKKDGNIALKDPSITVKQYDKPFNRTYDKAVDAVVDTSREEKTGVDLYQLLKNANDSYRELYDGSNRLTDSSEFKKMLGSFKEINEVFDSISAMDLKDNKITDEVFEKLEQQYGYTKKMLTDLLKDTAKNCKDYIDAKHADQKYRSTSKGNDRLVNASNFLNDLDPELAKTDLKDIKLKDSSGKKIVNEDTNDKNSRKLSLNDLMKEEQKYRRTNKITYVEARESKSRMSQRRENEKKAQQAQQKNNNNGPKK